MNAVWNLVKRPKKRSLNKFINNPHQVAQVIQVKNRCWRFRLRQVKVLRDNSNPKVHVDQRNWASKIHGVTKSTTRISSKTFKMLITKMSPRNSKRKLQSYSMKSLARVFSSVSTMVFSQINQGKLLNSYLNKTLGWANLPLDNTWPVLVSLINRYFNYMLWLLITRTSQLTMRFDSS